MELPLQRTSTFTAKKVVIIKKHLDEQHGIRSDLRCPNEKPCNYKLFGTKGKLVAHIKICGKKEKSIMCKVCTKRFRSQRSLNDHVKLHKDGNQDEELVIPCDYPGCPRTYKSRTSMLNHSWINTSGQPCLQGK